MNQALLALQWIKEVTKLDLIPPNGEKGFQDQFDFADSLKDGIALCS